MWKLSLDTYIRPCFCAGTFFVEIVEDCKLLFLQKNFSYFYEDLYQSAKRTTDILSVAFPVSKYFLQNVKKIPEINLVFNKVRELDGFFLRKRAPTAEGLFCKFFRTNVLYNTSKHLLLKATNQYLKMESRV